MQPHIVIAIREHWQVNMPEYRYIRAVAAGKRTPPGPLTRAVATILYDGFLESLLTQTQLGVLAGMPQSMVSEYLRGLRVLDIEQLDRLSRALGLTITDVIAAAKELAAD